jgi:hypothetical protein
LRTLVDAPGYADLAKEAAARAKGAIVAGEVLSTIYVMSRFGMKPTMNRAIWALQGYADEGAPFGDGTPFPKGERQIRKHWTAFRSVAHLWGAMGLNRAAAYPYVSEGDVFSTPENLTRFLGVAAELLNFGTSFVPGRARPPEPILDASACIRLPAHIERLRLESTELPYRLKQLLANYKAPLAYR